VGHVGLEFVVLDQDLDVAPAQLPAELLDGELKAVAELLAEHRGRARERGDHADLELFLRLRRRCKNGERRGGGERAKQSLHVGLSLAPRRITFRGQRCVSVKHRNKPLKPASFKHEFVSRGRSGGRPAEDRNLAQG
jgi:hypothetical protein